MIRPSSHSSSINKHNYIIPKQYRYLIKFPGVGEYTAKAIQGIAFNKPVMPIDSNIKRIFSRVYGITEKINRSEIKINTLANKLISLKNYLYPRTLDILIRLLIIHVSDITQ